MTEPTSIWRTIMLTKHHIDLKTLLTCGQSFTWKETSENVWSNVLSNIVFSLKQTPTEILWCTPVRDQPKLLLSCAPIKNGVRRLPATTTTLKRGIITTVDEQVKKGNKKKKRSDCEGDGLDDVSCNTSSSSTISTSTSSNAQSSSVTTTDPITTTTTMVDIDTRTSSSSKQSSSISPEKEFRPHGDDVGTQISNHVSSGNDVTDGEAEAILRNYFQLNVDLPSLYKTWSVVDKHFAKISDSFPGIRIMRQDPNENLFSFICSSNNHVSRISGMVHKLAEHYGTSMGDVGNHILYSFPTAEDLDKPGLETKLRGLGFGYRAKYIAATARIINRERPEGWLNSLRTLSYEECINQLTKLQGVGRKVADCVALMSLDKGHVVPVDTHVLQIAIRDYRIPGVSKDMKSLTPAIHDKIGKYFVDLYGEYAGWAHTVLFAADLKRFSNHSPAKSSKTTDKSEKSKAGDKKTAKSKAQPSGIEHKGAEKISRGARGRKAK